MCDFVFTIPVGPSFWPVSNFEPLIVGLYFSLLPFSAWQLRGSPFLDVMARGLSAVSRSDNNWGGIFCANLAAKRGIWPPCRRAWHGGCYCATDNGEFPVARPQDEEGEIMVIGEEEELRFMTARNGDNLVTPFQCDHCHFINIMGREPLEDVATGIRVLKCIRRVNLDAFWCREPGTVRGVLDETLRGLNIASHLGFAHSLFHPRGPFPLTDTFGLGAAIIIVQRSLSKGRYGPTAQYETIRKFRSEASNNYHSSVVGQDSVVMAQDTKKLKVTACPVYSDFFERFNKGLHKRMGDIVRPDRALSHELVKEILKLVDRDWDGAPPPLKLPLALEGAFYTIAFTLALRGE